MHLTNLKNQKINLFITCLNFPSKSDISHNLKVNLSFVRERGGIIRIPDIFRNDDFPHECEVIKDLPHAGGISTAGVEGRCQAGQLWTDTCWINSGTTRWDLPVTCQNRGLDRDLHIIHTPVIKKIRIKIRKRGQGRNIRF